MFVNSDDVLTPEALELLSKYDEKYKDIDFVWLGKKTLGSFTWI